MASDTIFPHGLRSYKLKFYLRRRRSGGMEIIMEINQETINQFLALDDEELKKAFRSIAIALGMNERFAAANTQRFKRMLATSNPKDIERMLSSIDPARAQEIMKTVNRGKDSRK